jgi:hypothetical protein
MKDGPIPHLEIANSGPRLSPVPLAPFSPPTSITALEMHMRSLITLLSNGTNGTNGTKAAGWWKSGPKNRWSHPNVVRSQPRRREATDQVAQPAVSEERR